MCDIINKRVSFKDTEVDMEINRRFKDTLFRKVFNNKKDLLSLYNALKDGRSDKLVKLTDKKELERLYKEYDM